MAVKRSTNGTAPEPGLGVTPAAEWRVARQGVVKELPSGRRVRLRPVDVSLLLLEGDIPDLLTPVVLTMFYGVGDVKDNPVASVLGTTRDEWPVINLICRVAFVEPRIVDEPQADDEIAIEDIDFLDRRATYVMVTQGLDALRRFRFQPVADLEISADGEADGDTPLGDVSTADVDAVGMLSV